MKLHRYLLLASVLVSSVAAGSAVDINSSRALQYYSDGDLRFEVNGTGNAEFQNDTFLNDNRIRGLADPEAPQDAVTRNWVNENAAGSLKETLGKGNTTGGYDLDVENANITSSTGNVSVEKGLKVYGDLWLAGNGDSGEVRSPFQNLTEVLKRGNSVGTYDLDMNGQKIIDIGGLQNCGSNEFVNGNGNCETDTTIQNTDNQDLSEVLAQGTSAGSYSIDLNGNNITDSSGKTTIGGAAEVSGGDLDLNGNELNDIGGLQNCGQNEFVNGNGNCELDTDTDQDNQTLQDVLAQGNSAGSNNIDINDQDITNVNNLGQVGEINGNVGEDLKIRTSGGGSDAVVIRDDANDQDIARFNEGGGVSVPSGRVGIGEASPETALDIGSSTATLGQIQTDDTNLQIRTAGTGSAEIKFQDASDSDSNILRLQEGGLVQVSSGKLNVGSPDSKGNAVNVGGSLQTDGDLKAHSGNVGSDTRMCIGDRCA